MEPSISHDTATCRAVAEVLARIGDKWTVYIVRLLSRGPMRFNEMRREVSAISQRMLSLTLRGLERDGLVKRTVTPSIPPRVDYELTVKGKTLIDPLKAVGLWAIANRDYIEKARLKYDAAHEGSKALKSLKKRKTPAVQGRTSRA
ncbi:MAG: helix-turn-helix domain-containing protein [Hyphomicrobiales bacterium]